MPSVANDFKAVCIYSKHAPKRHALSTVSVLLTRTNAQRPLLSDMRGIAREGLHFQRYRAGNHAYYVSLQKPVVTWIQAGVRVASGKAKNVSTQAVLDLL